MADYYQADYYNNANADYYQSDHANNQPGWHYGADEDAKQERKASLRPKENVPVLQFSKALPHPKDMADVAKSEAGVKFDPETGEPTQIVTTAGEVSTFEGGINVGAEVSAVFESPRLE